MNTGSRLDGANGAPITVLIAEDNEEDYIITRDLLAQAAGTKYHVDWVATYDGALQSFEQAAYDVYLFDYHLGERSGLDLLRDMANLGSHTPVIMLTGTGSMEVDFGAMDAGAADYLVKQELTAPLLERSIRYAIKHAQMTEELRRLATHDQLTGLLNRREMDRILGEEFIRQKRYQHPFAFLMLDIDRFKNVNDTYGHQTGDDVLCEIAKRLGCTVRLTDRVARYGGEEIAIIAPNTEAEGAVALAERVRKAIATQPFVIKGDTEQPLRFFITASIGVATIPDHADSTRTLVLASDQALYAAKRNGRNCTVLFEHGLSSIKPIHTPDTPGEERTQQP